MVGLVVISLLFINFSLIYNFVRMKNERLENSTKKRFAFRFTFYGLPKFWSGIGSWSVFFIRIRILTKTDPKHCTYCLKRWTPYAWNRKESVYESDIWKKYGSRSKLWEKMQSGSWLWKKKSDPYPVAEKGGWGSDH